MDLRVPRQPGCWEPGILSGILPWPHHQRRLPYFVKMEYVKTLVPGADSPGYELAVWWLNTCVSASLPDFASASHGLLLIVSPSNGRRTRVWSKCFHCSGAEPVRPLCQATGAEARGSALRATGNSVPGQGPRSASAFHTEPAPPCGQRAPVVPSGSAGRVCCQTWPPALPHLCPPRKWGLHPP